MAARTGDLANNLRRMQVALRMLQYPGDVSTKDAREGLPEVFLPLIHHALLSYSRHVAGWLAAQGHDLFGKSDLRFIEGAFKVLRDDFKYVPKLTRDQFFAAGFAEQKAILVADVARLCIDKHELLLRQEPKRKSTNGSSARRESNGSAGPANPPAPSAASTTQPRARTSPPAPAPPLLHPPVPAPSASPLASSTPALPDAAPVSGSEEGAATAAGPAAGSTVTQDAWDGEPQQAPSVPPLNPSPPLVAPLHGAQWSQHPPQPFTASSSSSRRVVFAAEPQRFPPSPRGDSELHVRDLGDEALDIATVYAPQYEPDQGPADVWVTSQLRLENRAREQASVQSLAQQPVRLLSFYSLSLSPHLSLFFSLQSRLIARLVPTLASLLCHPGHPQHHISNRTVLLPHTHVGPSRAARARHRLPRTSGLCAKLWPLLSRQ
eukprot:m.215085 g.215085  ORF g.215085 m.215085 type:complete len:435 (-) comp15588_c2_seq1:576-1880(-)